jgi:hypothetical protein
MEAYAIKYKNGYYAIDHRDPVPLNMAMLYRFRGEAENKIKVLERSGLYSYKVVKIIESEGDV